MKKALIPRTVCAILLAMVALVAAPTASAQMQRGDKCLGIGAGVATYNTGGYVNLFFQYSFSSHVRIAPEVGYVFKHDDKSCFDVSLDMEFPFRIFRGIYVYPLAGVTFNHWNYDDKENKSRLGLDAGAGIDFFITSNFKVNLQGKCSFMSKSTGGFFNVGFGYVF